MTLRRYPTIAASVLAAAFFLAATPAFADTSLAIQSLSPGSSVNVGSSLTFTAITSGLSAPITYTISDTLSGSTLSSSNFASGSSNLSWTPAAADVGTHNVTVTATDGSSQTASVQQTITVLPAPSVSLESISPDTKVPVGTELTFTATPSNFSNTSYSFTLSDTDSVSTIKNSNIDSSGHFKWTPRSVDLGLHTLTVQVNAGSQMAKVSQRIDVLDASYVPAASSDSSRTLTLTPLSPSTTVAVGTPISATAVTTGFTPTSYFTSDSFPGTSITYATVSASGIFSWTPTAADIGTHTIKIVGYDNGGDNAATSTTITVTATGGTAATPAPITAVAPTPVSAIASAPAAAAHVFTTLLQKGDTGSDVLALQQILAAAGFLAATPNGLFGPQTEAAVKAYQSAHGISPLGVVGPQTRALLNAGTGTVGTYTAVPTTSASGSGLSAAARQTLLTIVAAMQQIILQLTTLANQ